MGLRCLVALLVAEALLCSAATGSRMRHRRQVPESADHTGTKPYKLPLLQSAPSAPVALSATIQNSYQPPISLIRSNEYQAAPAHTSYSVHQQPQQPQRHQQQYYPQLPPSYSVHQQQSSGPQQYQQSSGPQQYQQQSSGSQQYQQQSSGPQQYQQASSGPQQSYSIYQQPSVPQPTNLATSYSVHQQPAAASNARQPFAVFDGSSSGGHPQSTAERTYSTHTKVVGSHVPAQAIHKAPASEIQSEDKATLAKDRDAMKDEYVVYYYYYYDNDTAPSNNLSLNFDDIPSLESYDNDGLAKEPQKSASARALAANALAPASEPKRDSAPASESSSSQPRSASGADRENFARGGDRFNLANTDTIVQPLKPVSNVFRYGSNEVPRFPVLPNFVVSEAPTSRPTTPDTLSSESSTTQASVSSHVPSVNRHEDHESDDFNTVLDHSTDLKSEDKVASDEAATTTTTEEPTTTEIPTTSTTERSRRRPPIGGGGGRRRFNSSPSFAPNRSRQSPTRGTTSSSSSTTTTTSATPTRGSFRGSNRLRPRPNLNGNRPNRLQTDDTSSREPTPSPASTTPRTTSTTSSGRSRFTTSAAPRRFQSSRSRSGTSSTTSTTSTTARTPPASARSRPSTRPRPNPITRNRPPRPGFLRPKAEEAETTTVPAETSPSAEETSPSAEETSAADDSEDNETDEDSETSEEGTEEPATTEANRFSALFRPRNRNAIGGNRPRPVIGNRPPRS